LSLTDIQPSFNNIAKEHDIDLISGDRGAPENTGFDFKASQYVLALGRKNQPI
jgi:hypothetical protein